MLFRQGIHNKPQNNTSTESNRTPNNLIIMIMPPLSKNNSSIVSLSSLKRSGGSVISICQSAPTCWITVPHPFMSLLSSSGHLLLDGVKRKRRFARTKKESTREQAASRSDCVCHVHPSPRCQYQPEMGGLRSSRRSSSSSSSSSSRKNEVWAVLVMPSQLPSQPEKSDEAVVVVVEEKRRVRFAASNDETRTMVAVASSNDDDRDASATWHQAEDDHRFLLDAISRSETVNRMMAYAAGNESSFNRTTGLTSPQVLKEYLSNPEEVIGIEHMLAGQKNDRESLKRHHRNALVEEMRRQRQEGGRGGCVDADALARCLRTTSEISAHMAQQRAVYINLLD